MLVAVSTMMGYRAGDPASRSTAMVSLCLILLLHLQYVVTEGAWSTWGGWEECTASCGGGIMMRTRSCDVTNTCVGDPFSYVPCNKNSCPEDGYWLEWEPWATCTLSCGGGVQSRQRECEGPYGGGEPCPGLEYDHQDCNEQPCPIDGGWGPWTTFSECSLTCGGGISSRERLCDTPLPLNNGRHCVGDSTDYVACSTDPCSGNDVTDGNWGPWAPFGDCSSTCGTGIRMRLRSCTNPSPANGGADCSGTNEQESGCDLLPCPRDGAWGWWGSWTQCDQQCEGGQRERHRSCTNPSPAYGGSACVPENIGDSYQETQEDTCNTAPCPLVDGSWGAWTEEGSCSLTCGGGIRLRVRYCDSPAASNGGRICAGGDPGNPGVQTDSVGCNFNLCPTHGNWSPWSDYTSCPVTCGFGESSRYRTCTAPSPAHGGRECLGLSTDSIPCSSSDCTIDGGWSAWTSYSSCSLTCGWGTKQRTRNCDSPAPSGSGTQCSGASEEVLPCSLESCQPVDGQWSIWGTWGDCSKTCDDGLRLRLRTCNSPTPEHNGKSCEGRGTQSEACGQEKCLTESASLIAGKWTTWTSWSDCSRSCGGGQQRRDRICQNPESSGSSTSCADSGPDSVTREIEIIVCSDQTCPVSGQWSEWSVWGECSVTCNTGTTTRSRLCNAPAPAHGGLNCLGAGPFSNQDIQIADCERDVCGVQSASTTQPARATLDMGSRASGSTTTTISVPVGTCPEEDAWDGRKWPDTPLGHTVELVCPQPTTGLVYRKCEDEADWGVPDTSDCKSTNFEQLEREVDGVYSDVVILTDTLASFKQLCNGESISVAGDLLSCIMVFRSLINGNYLEDSRVTDNDKKKFVQAVVDSMDTVLDQNNADKWYILTREEEEDDVSVLADITLLFEELGQQVALFLLGIGGSKLCATSSNIDMCVYKLTCGTAGFRYPPQPIEPTPPPKHERGGWVPLPAPTISHSSLSTELIESLSCAEDGTSTVPTYLTTVVYSTLQHLLPDENKQAILPDQYGDATDDRNVETLQSLALTRTVNAPVISTSISFSSFNETPLSVPLSLTFYHEQEGTNGTCAFLDLSDQKRLYKTSGCAVVYTDDNYTKCSCDHMTSFVVLMQKGHFKEHSPLFARIDSFITVACIFSLVILTAIIICYIFLRMYSNDTHFLLLLSLVALLACHLLILAGGGAWRHEHACKFVTFGIHYFLTVCFTSQLCAAAHFLKQVRVQRPLGFWKRCICVVICWGLPLLICGSSLGLLYDDYYSQKLCFFSWDHAAGLAFLLPTSTLTIVTLLLVAWASVMQRKSRNSRDQDIKYMRQYETKFRFEMRRLGMLTVLNYVTWTVFASMYGDIWPFFMILDLALHVYIVVTYTYQDEEFHAAISDKKKEFKSARDERRRRALPEPSWVTHMKLGKKPNVAEDAVYGTKLKAAEKQKMQRFVYLPAANQDGGSVLN